MVGQATNVQRRQRQQPLFQHFDTSPRALRSSIGIAAASTALTEPRTMSTSLHSSSNDDDHHEISSNSDNSGTAKDFDDDSSAETATTMTVTDDNDDNDDDSDDDDDDSNARSQFGTRYYWDELYQGRGDFPADEYQWYYGWDQIQSILDGYLSSTTTSSLDLLVLGIGNDPILLDLLQDDYTTITATDYVDSAIERQRDLLEFDGYGDYISTNDDNIDSIDRENGTSSNQGNEISIHLCTMDARRMDPTWTDRFDLILEKGCLDAIYLSGDGNLERVEQELTRILKPSSGILCSVSGVVPDNVRRTVFSVDRWKWLRDGTDDLKAGCFVYTPTKEG